MSAKERRIGFPVRVALALVITFSGMGAIAAPRGTAMEIETLVDEAELLADIGNDAAAEPLFRQALTLKVQQYGPEAKETAVGYSDLALSLEQLGRFTEAGSLMSKAVAIWRRTYDDNHEMVPFGLSALARMHESRGRIAAAEPLHREVLQLVKTQRGDVSGATRNVASNLLRQGRFSDAEEVARAAIKLGPDVFSGGDVFGVLGEALQAQGKEQEADPFFRQWLAMTERLHGENSDGITSALTGLAQNLLALGRTDEAAGLYRRAISVREALFGADHFSLAPILEGLARVRFDEKNFNEARQLLLRARSIRSALPLEEEAQDGSYGAWLLALTLSQEGQFDESERILSEAIEALRKTRTAAIIDAGVERGGSLARAAFGDQLLDTYLGVSWRLAKQDPTRERDLRAKAFVVAQERIQSAAAVSLAQTTARLALGSGALADRIREIQDLSRLIAKLDKQYIAALGDRRADAAKPEQILRKLQDAKSRRFSGQADIERLFPNYRSLINPAPLPIDTSLQPDEAMLLLIEADGHVYTFASSSGGATWHRVDAGAAAVSGTIRKLRCEMDQLVLCNEDEIQALRARDDTSRDVSPFDAQLAYSLYRDLIHPLGASLEGVDHLLVSTSNTLGDLPLNLLVTSPPPVGQANSAGLLSLRWFADSYAISKIPSLSGIRSRSVKRLDTSVIPFVGYGAPILEGQRVTSATIPQRGGSPRSRRRSAPTKNLFRVTETDAVSLADPNLLRLADPLPETGPELEDLAKALGANSAMVRLGANATETAVKRDHDLSQANVVAFATHGLLPGQVDGLQEPGLILTPPTRATAFDDGLLAASEVATLKLAADLVILSACNTASTEGAGGSDSLSALAKAFIYAGSKSLLASHWSVPDQATRALTLEVLNHRSKNPESTWAESLRIAMRTVRTGVAEDGRVISGYGPTWAHPSAWAAFSMVSGTGD